LCPYGTVVGFPREWREREREWEREREREEYVMYLKTITQ
jgi:hypothetical protein